jgi:hypothetical protein
MKREKRSKWNIGTVILKGKQSSTLMKTYHKELEHRLKPEEPEQHEANVAELEMRRSGQPVSMVDQKSKTFGQNFAIKMVLVM